MNNNLVEQAWVKAVAGTREILRKLIDSDEHFEVIKVNHLKNHFDKLNLPDPVERCLDEDWTPSPMRYIVCGAELVPLFVENSVTESTAVPMLKSHGFKNKYEIFSENLFPINMVVVLEDDGDQIKLYRKFKIEWAL